MLADQRAGRIVATRPARIQVTSPVPPQRPGIGAELRHRDSAAPQRLCRALTAERRHHVDDIEDLGRHPQLGRGHVAQDLGPTTDLEQRCGGGPGQRPDQRRQPGRGGDAAVDLAQARRRRRGQVEGLAVAAVEVHQRRHRRNHVVDRHDVGASAVGQHHRGEARQPRERGQHAEEVVGAVDLVHLAGARIADDHPRAVDAVSQPVGGADQALGVELGPVVGRRQVLAEVEVLLGEHPAMRTGHRDGRHVVQRRVQAPGQSDHRPGALDVGDSLAVLGGGDVVDRGAVDHVVDRTESLDNGVAQAEVRCREVADQRLHPLVGPADGQAVEAAERLGAHQHVHGCGARQRQDFGDQSATDEPGTAGNDIAHASHRHGSPDKGQQ